MKTVIHRYIWSELIPPFLVNLVFFIFIFIMAELLKIINLMVNYRAGVGSVGLIIVYAMPQFLMFILPMAAMMSVLLTLIRMTGDSEIVALKSGGVGIGCLVPPVMLFCLLVCLLTLFMSLYGKPWSKRTIKQITYRIAVSSFDAALKQQRFIGQFDGLMIYISEMDIRTRELEDVFIEDSRNRELVATIVAPKGKIFSVTDDTVVHLRLYDGSINQTDLKNRSTNAVQFDHYDLFLDLKETVRPPKSRKREDEMSLGELLGYLNTFDSRQKKYYKALNELHVKFSIPAAALALGLIAIPLGLQMRSSRKASGFGMGIAVFLLYYIMMTIGLVLGEKGILNPAWGLWLPNILSAGIGAFLLHRTAVERSIPGLPFVERWVETAVARWLRLLAWLQHRNMKGPRSPKH
jgi:lipopolysaccharide export system permease protein